MATISAGDIAFIGFNADGNDDFAIVALTDLDGSSTAFDVTFTDNEWDGSLFNGGEGTLTWTIDSLISAGTVIAFNNTSNAGSVTASVGSVSLSGSLNLGASNEAIFAFTGTLATPNTFLAAIANDDFGAASATLTNTGLVVGTTAIELDGVDADADVAVYTGTQSDTQANLLAAINDPTHWSTQDGSGDQSNDGIAPDLPFGTTAFTVADAGGGVTTLFEADFESFAGAGFAPTPAANQLDSDEWRITGFSDGDGAFGGTHTTGDFARGMGTGGVSSGGAYAFETGGNVILGIQPTGSDFTPGTITLQLTNTTGATLTRLDVGYDIFFNNDQARGNSLNFAYSNDDVSYTSVGALDFTTPEAADGTGFQSVSQSIPLTGLNIAAGADFYLQWQGDDVSGGGSRDEYGIDNILITSGSSEPTVAIAATDADQLEGDSGTAAFTFTVTRSQTNGAASVDYAVSSSVADANDFDGGVLPSGTVNFAEGEAAQDIEILVSGDTDIETSEDFTVTLSNSSAGLTIETATADGTIQNDDLPLTLISAIQGSSDASPLDGQVVQVEAIVVGDFQDGDADTGRDLRGFYIQEEDADADGNALTSEGIFVFEGGDFITDVNIGDKVRVTGTVDEFFGETQIDTITDITVVSSGNVLPTAASIALPSAAVTTSQDGDFQPDLEAYEGMRVTFSDQLTITEMFQLDRFNEIKLSQGDRLEQFTQNNLPDVAGFAQHQEDNGARTITYDDGLNFQNQPIDNLDGFAGFNTANAPTMGDTITGLSGVLSYQWAGNSASGATWRVRSAVDGTNTFADTNPREATPDDVGGSLKVASFNVLNFFTTLDTFPGNEGVGPNGLSPRGADTNPQNALPGTGPLDEYDRQLAKLVEALAIADADVVGLVELENDFLKGGTSPNDTGAQDPRDIAIQELVNALNAKLGVPGAYDWVDPGSEFVGGDAIAVGFIYDTRTVNLVGNAAILDSPAFLDPNNTGEGKNRAALAQTFEEIASGETFTASVNHFKSKGDSGLDANDDGIPDDPSNPDSDQLDGQGYWNDTRTQAAQELAAWLATDPTGAGDSDVLILGDLNAYANEDPVRALEAEGYTDLAEQFLGDEAYSFVFDGQTGTLDYAMANATLLDQVTGATEWHINADEADALDYNLEFGRDPSLFDGTNPFRSSDHDPVIIGLNLATADADDLDISLYDAASDTEIAPLTEGAVVSLAQIANLNNVSIAATVSADSAFFGQVGSIVLDLNNGSKTRTENVTPYALFGDKQGNFRGGSSPQGSNTITFQLFRGSRGRGELLGTVTRNFTLADIPPVNLAPNAVDDAFFTVADQTLTGNVASNDSDPNGDALTFALETAASNGTVVLNANGTFEYTPDPDFTGTDSFSYQVSDGELTDTAMVDLVINPQGFSPLQVGLYDTRSDQLIRFIQTGDTIDTAGLSTQNLTLAAVVADGSPLAGQVQSIELDLNNGQATRTENVSPYALFGDTNGNFFTGSGLPQGANQIEFELYSQKRGNGLLLDTVVVDFTLV